MATEIPPAMGPVEMMLIGFPENRFDGSIVPAMQELVDSGTIRVLDLVSDEDLRLAGEQLAPNSSAALVLWEDSWASKLTAAVGSSGGEVLMYDRIPAAVMADALAAQA